MRGNQPAGRSFAQSCLVSGFHVILEDVLPARLRQAEGDFASITQGSSSGARLDLVLTVEDAVRKADVAVDFVPDELESKLEIFSMLDRMAPPHTILCTPSEVLSITDLASCIYRPERCLIVRGASTPTGWNIQAASRLLYPPSADSTVLSTIETFFAKLGVALVPELDIDTPMLVKNTV